MQEREECEKRSDDQRQKGGSLARRDFLKASGFAIAGLASVGALGGCSPDNASSPSVSGEDGSEGPAANAEIGVADSFDASSARYDVDVVVVGSGAAGISAAVEAADQGGKVLLVERGAEFGGSTAFAEGILGFRSKYQLENGIDFDIDKELMKDVEFSGYLANYALLRRFFDMADENIVWLENNGVEFYPEPNLHSPTQVFYVGQGKEMVAIMAGQAESKGATLLTSTRAKRLHLEDGKIAGLIVEDDTGEYPILTKAVILATGGILNSPELFEQSFPFHYDRVMVTAAPYHEGDGLVMAHAAGGDDAGVFSIGWVWCGLKSFSIHSELSTAACNEPYFWINETGKRFIPESLLVRFSAVPNATISQKRALSILTQKEVDRLMTEGCTVGWGSYIFAGDKLEKLQKELDEAKASSPEGFFYAETLEDLAIQLEIDAATLAETVAEYNDMVAAGEDTQFFKPAEYLREVPAAGPFYAFELQSNACSVQGGITINENCEVIDSEGAEIDGLYAAGVDCSGYTGFYYNDLHGGDNQAFAVFSGRTSAQNAVALANL